MGKAPESGPLRHSPLSARRRTRTRPVGLLVHRILNLPSHAAGTEAAALAVGPTGADCWQLELEKT